MNPIIIQAIQFFMSLSLLIILHELGHFIPAKIFKTRVEKFYLFFDVKFSLFKKKIGDTVYGIGWLPLGGYVKISGMIDESMDVEAMKEEPKPWEFRSKPAWQRLIIMTGGVLVNFILAVVIYIGMAYSYGEQFIANESVKDGVYVAYPEIGDQLGIQTGDKIIAVDGEPIERFSQIFMEIVNGNEITIDRDGQLITQEIPVDFISTLLEDQEKARFLSFRQPFVIGEVASDSANASAGLEAGDQFISINGQPSYYVDQAKELLDQNKGGQITALVEDQNGARRNVTLSVNDEGKIGIAFKLLTMEEYQERGIFEVETKKYSLVESIPVGIDKGVSTLSGYVKQVKKIVNPETGAYKGVGGFAAIGGLFPDTWNWEAFWGTTALISIILAFMNILPIPALDGGHVMFLLYEMISGRKPSDKFLEYAQLVGFVLLLGLLVFANGNDLYKLFVK
ncbi:MAG: RIP metalloprotease RseP [Flavobacteriaceae bacterium]|jgi:regulator of sigma E protease|nr:RIP metalloprotease RseP [Flavobacteriaceae bacterium]NVJ73433.1 RIP metalloprotease RseP [Flavobacteriaceae bacterium]